MTMKLCQEGHDGIVFDEKHWNQCPLCHFIKWIEELEVELKEAKADLHELNLKMAPELSEDSVEENR
jgi:hypothetical protein